MFAIKPIVGHNVIERRLEINEENKDVQRRERVAKVWKESSHPRYKFEIVPDKASSYLAPWGYSVCHPSSTIICTSRGREDEKDRDEQTDMDNRVFSMVKRQKRNIGKKRDFDKGERERDERS